MTATPRTGDYDSLQRLKTARWDFSSANTKYLTHNLHPYPAKFIPQIPNLLIQELSQPNDTVADIFCGSGTTLLEALQLKRNAIGIDANPIAALISKAKTTRLTDLDLHELANHRYACERLLDTILRMAKDSRPQNRSFVSSGWRPAPEVSQFWFLPHVVEELAELLTLISGVKRESASGLCKVAFSSIVVRVSKQDSDSRYVRRAKAIEAGATVRHYLHQLTSAITTAQEMSQAVDKDLTCQVLNANVLDHPQIEDLQLVVTSPPYPNAYSYHLYHRTRLLWLGYDAEGFKSSEIGSHRKYSAKGRARATANTFREEFETIFHWLRYKLEYRRYACFVIGDSRIDGERIDNASLLSAVAARSGFREVARIQRQIPSTRKALNPRIGGIHRENILILRKA